MTKFAFAAAVAASLTILAAPAVAEDITVNVPYADLDMSTAAGAAALANRIDAGVDAACERPDDMRNLKSMSAFEACKISAVASASAQLTQAGATLALK